MVLPAPHATPSPLRYSFTEGPQRSDSYSASQRAVSPTTMYSAQTSPVPVYVLSPFCVPHRCEDVRYTLHSRVERESVLVRSSHARESRDTGGEIIHAVHTVPLARTRTFECYLDWST